MKKKKSSPSRCLILVGCLLQYGVRYATYMYANNYPRDDIMREASRVLALDPKQEEALKLVRPQAVSLFYLFICLFVCFACLIMQVHELSAQRQSSGGSSSATNGGPGGGGHTQPANASEAAPAGPAPPSMFGNELACYCGFGGNSAKQCPHCAEIQSL